MELALILLYVSTVVVSYYGAVFLLKKTNLL